jgi:oxalate decarboxylase
MKHRTESEETSSSGSNGIGEELGRRKFITAASAVLAGLTLSAGQAAAQNIPEIIDAEKGASANDPGQENQLMREASPSRFLPPPTDRGDVEQFWNSFSIQHRRIQPGGWTRQVNVKSFPISTDIAGVSNSSE